VTGPLVVVAGALANKPDNGGEAWVRMSFVRGLRRLGCRVGFLEEILPEVLVDSHGHHASPATSINVGWFESVTTRFGLKGSSALLCDGRPLSGLAQQEISAMAESADLLVNISGNLGEGTLRHRFGRRAFVDLDPGFTQMWTAMDRRSTRVENHHFYFTVGLNVGQADCVIPTNDLEWVPLPPPVVLSDWPARTIGVSERRRFTTIATWRGPYGPVEWDRRRFGLKVHEFRKLIPLPTMVDAHFEAALAIHPDEVADLALLADNGWFTPDPRIVARSPNDFRSYVAASGAEFSAAQEMYVATNSGWFSDRTTRYLACGRPALVQDTGFTSSIPAGKGVVVFSTLDEAAYEAERMLADWDKHSTAARDLAEQHFDSDLVLSRFLGVCGVR
jgi:hypothetical protein